jgi:hypothetical protein
MGKRYWTDEDLREAVALARCLADVMRTLGVKQQRTIVARAKQLGLEIPLGKRTGWTDDEFRTAVAGATSVRGALKLSASLGVATITRRSVGTLNAWGWIRRTSWEAATSPGFRGTT